MCTNSRTISVHEVEHATAGNIKLIGPVPKMSESPPTIYAAPPTLGQHTDEILMGLGYTEVDIQQLRAEGIVEVGGTVVTVARYWLSEQARCTPWLSYMCIFDAKHLGGRMNAAE